MSFSKTDGFTIDFWFSSGTFEVLCNFPIPAFYASMGGQCAGHVIWILGMINTTSSSKLSMGRACDLDFGYD